MKHNWSEELESQWCDECQTWKHGKFCNCPISDPNQADLFDDEMEPADLFGPYTDEEFHQFARLLTPDEQQRLKFILELHFANARNK